MDFRFEIIADYLPLLLRGALVTIAISAASIVIGSALGLVVAWGKLSANFAARYLASGYIHFFRGTPLLVQILLVHFGIVYVILGKTDAMIAAIVALSLNSAAYTAEIYRAGVQSIDKGQTEAARSLGMTHFQTMRFIILPQAIKRMIPPFGNEFIVLIKDSSLVSIIAAQELMYWTDAFKGQYLAVWEPYLTAAFIYLVLTYSFSKLLNYVERRLQTS
ncbi:amino acid ABC transporter permease [Cohnella kolymensis]|uniref:Amino acid ABC transporter permease n=1 Tax=Cohnella kolymensis TaxID=1590652 RepID=A0ABR5A972_9BACL|nr:amino acid ABC transporter permease [Cohnella kolymensis]KIL37569.1 amino acid ABC transporter permease [Cohnella kolymensis]